MPPLPKRRHSTRRQGKRRQSLKLKNPTLGVCPNCGNPVSPHTVCPNCGFYKGREVIKRKEKKPEK